MGGQEQKCLIDYTSANEAFDSQFQKCKPFHNRLNRYPEIATRTWPIMNVCAICCWLEIVGDVISSENVNTTEGYALLNLEAASFSSFQENQKQPLA